MKSAKRILALVLCAAMAVSLAACGKKKNQNDGPIQQESEYVYVPEYINMPDTDDDSWYNEIQLVGDSIYYNLYSYNEETRESSERFMKYSLADGSSETIFSLTDSGTVNYFRLDKDGNIYIIYTVWGEYDEVTGESDRQYFLRKYMPDGNMVYEQDFTEVMLEDEENGYVQNMAVDAEGRVYICCGTLIRTFDEQGQLDGEISTTVDWIGGMGTGKDGEVYITYYDYNSNNGGFVLAHVDYDRKKIGDTYSGMPNINGSNLWAGINKDFLLYDSTGLYEYDMASKTYETILKWLDSDINGDYVQAVGASEDGHIYAVTSDWESSDNTTEIVKLTKTKTSDVTQKTELTLATMYQDQSLQAAAVAFNKSNDTYRIIIKNYLDYDNMSENSYEDAMTQFNNDIISSDNCPDMIDLSCIDEKQMAAKGVLEDLMPYLEKGGVLNKDSLADGIIENFKYDGKLYGIPRTVQLNTVVGKTSIVGDKKSWTLEEMMEAAEENPGASLFYGVDKSTMLYYCLLFNDGVFIDWNTGTCKFDTPEFVQLLEFINMFPDEFDWGSYDDSVEKYQKNKVLLESAYISDFKDVQYYEAEFGEPVTFVGFPTVDGSSGCAMSSQGRYAMTASSSNKDGVWEFIEFYLTRDSSMFDWGLYSIQEKLDKQIEEVTKVEYVRDENGEIMYDEEGEPIEANNGTSSIVSSNGWEYTYRRPTQEEVDLTLELFAGAKPVSENTGSETLSIIQEEAEAFFKGQKSAEDVAAIIQNRLQIYVSENS